MNLGEGFEFDNHNLMVFFRYCRRYDIDDRERRIELLRRMVARKQAQYLPNPQDVIRGKVLIIKPNREGN